MILHHLLKELIQPPFRNDHDDFAAADGENEEFVDRLSVCAEEGPDEFVGFTDFDSRFPALVLQQAFDVPRHLQMIHRRNVTDVIDPHLD